MDARAPEEQGEPDPPGDEKSFHGNPQSLHLTKDQEPSRVDGSAESEAQEVDATTHGLPFVGLQIPVYREPPRWSAQAPSVADGVLSFTSLSLRCDAEILPTQDLNSA